MYSDRYGDKCSRKARKKGKYWEGEGETRLITSLLVGEGEIGDCQKYELREVACFALSPHLYTPPHLYRWPGGCRENTVV